MAENIRIIDLPADDAAVHLAIAEMLVAAFAGTGTAAWPDVEAGLEEVREALEPERINRIAVDDAGAVLGWIGGIPQYDGHVWELHPLVVAPAHQRRGIGQALVADLEAEARRRGGLTLWLGSDDENFRTSIGGVDLYPDVLAHLAALRDVSGHPFTFYQRVGFVVVGAVPDANGRGKPDIYMAKRL
jgi:aminoglycoside 6'-N-acetyltransferase I